MNLEDMWDFLAGYGFATDDEIDLVTRINGYNEKSLEDILYIRTGYLNFDQIDQIKEEYGLE